MREKQPKKKKKKFKPDLSIWSNQKLWAHYRLCKKEAKECTHKVLIEDYAVLSFNFMSVINERNAALVKLTKLSKLDLKAAKKVLLIANRNLEDQPCMNLAIAVALTSLGVPKKTVFAGARFKSVHDLNQRHPLAKKLYGAR